MAASGGSSSRRRCYDSKLQPSVNVASKKPVYGLLTSKGRGFQSPPGGEVLRFRFQVSARVNTAGSKTPPRPHMLGESERTATGRSRSCGKTGKESGNLAVGKHLVGYGVLVGEPLVARQVFVHRRDDLQDVVVRGQG